MHLSASIRPDWGDEESTTILGGGSSVLSSVTSTAKTGECDVHDNMNPPRRTRTRVGAPIRRPPGSGNSSGYASGSSVASSMTDAGRSDGCSLACGIPPNQCEESPMQRLPQQNWHYSSSCEKNIIGDQPQHQRVCLELLKYNRKTTALRWRGYCSD